MLQVIQRQVGPGGVMHSHIVTAFRQCAKTGQNGGLPCFAAGEDLLNFVKSFTAENLPTLRDIF